MYVVVSVNTGKLAPLKVGLRTRRTGIAKAPVEGAVGLSRDGVAGDEIGNHTHHGGPDQAVYLYAADDLARWQVELGRPLPPGSFGENLTLDRWWEEPRVGDRLQVGSVLLELTFPRIPCSTFAAHLGVPNLVKRFTRGGNPGSYARVVAAGSVARGDAVTVLPAPPSHPTITSLLELWVSRRKDPELVRQALAAPIGDRARAALETGGW